MPKNLIGRKIVGVAWLTGTQAGALGIGDMYMSDRNPVQALALDDGTYITALQDAEGNGAGFLVRGDNKTDGSWDVEPTKVGK